jgi:predicted nucleic acid-binding protein
MKRTFVDAGVLIAAARGTTDVSHAAMQILTDPGRSFLSSLYVRLEVEPKAIYFKQEAELRFYERYFAAVAEMCPMVTSPGIPERAYTLACRFGLSAIDALHVAAAEALGADELVTTERPGKPLLRVTTLPIISISPA